MAEDERSIVRRSGKDIKPLMRGGLIIGGLENVQGPLVSMTGFALERITRERVGTPPHVKLPERPVYLLDPASRRLIMISNRESRESTIPKGREPWYGLFAEVVQLDEEGRPQYYLDSPEVILPDTTFQPVAIGPNEFNLPPSHIDVIDETEESTKPIPWNDYLAQLEDWMNELKIEEGEDLQAFVSRLAERRRESERKVETQIREVFPGGLQAMTESMAPVNVIITDQGESSPLYRASISAEFFPILLDAEALSLELAKREGRFPREAMYDIKSFEPVHMLLTPGSQRFDIAVVTLDQAAHQRLQEQGAREEKAILARLNKEERKSPTRIFNATEHKRRFNNLSAIDELFQAMNPIFARIRVRTFDPSLLYGKGPEHFNIPDKTGNGAYIVGYDERLYAGLLNKLRADLFLTMFVRGGAPIVK